MGIILFVAASCGEDKVAPKSGAAGLVIAVQGEASATRPGEALRTLKLNDTVFSDDTIVTGPSSSLEIELAHNGARWQLSADNERRVDSSLAWRAKRQSVAALEPNEDIKTGSAGRNSVREAAESRETLMAELDDPELEEAPEPETALQQKESSSSKSGKDGGKRSIDSKPKPSQKQSMPPPPAVDVSAAEERAGETIVAPSDNSRSDSDSRGDSDDSDDRDDRGDSEKESEADDDAPSLRSHIIALAKRCHAKHGGRGDLQVVLTTKSGKATDLRLSAPEALKATRSCLDSELRKTVLPGKGPLSLTISLP